MRRQIYLQIYFAENLIILLVLQIYHDAVDRIMNIKKTKKWVMLSGN